MTKARLLLFVLLLGVTLSLTTRTPISASLSSHPSLAFAQSAVTNRPNILLIMGDDLGYSDIGSFGSEIHTPNLDALAKQGMILTNYHAMPTCSPARLALLTGVDNHIGGLGAMAETLVSNQVGKPGYDGYINHKVVTVAELLRDGGYNTRMAGKWHLSGEGYHNGTTPYDRGFQDSFSLLNGGGNHFNSEPEVVGHHLTFVHNNAIVSRPDNTTYSSDLYTNMLIDQIKNVQGNGKPLFMYLSFQVGHSPYQAPQAYINKYQGVYQVGYDKIREERFAKQKELGLWPANTSVPKAIPGVPEWNNLTLEEQNYRAKILAVRAAMIDEMDYNIGKLIQYLKSIGKYDNTLIIFASDNGSSEPIEMAQLAGSGGTPEQTKAFLSNYNNTLANLGNANSFFNSGIWGTAMEVSPLSYFKSTMGEGGVRPPFVIKLPQETVNTTAASSPSPLSASSSSTSSNQSRPKIINAFVDVTDITPTLLDYAGVPPPAVLPVLGSATYHGMGVHAIMGKSIRPLLEGKVEKIHADNELIAKEFADNTAVYMGDWKAEKNVPPFSDGKWHLYNYVSDIGENKDVSAQHPDILSKMISYYNTYAKDVGVIVPIGKAALLQAADDATG
jgi:arylsulfatase A-like enzyme